MMKNLLKRLNLGLCFVLILSACGRPAGPSASPAPIDAIPQNAERPEYIKVKDVSDYLNSPMMEIPDPVPIPGWKRQATLKEMEFQAPENFQPQFKTSVTDNAVPALASAPKISSTRRGFVFRDGEIRVNFSIWSNIQPEELIRRNNIYETTLIDVRRLTKPRKGFYFKFTSFGDYIQELLLAEKNDTYQFRVVRPQKGTEKEAGKFKISDEELLKILYSLKLPSQ